jgi:hypothetical protein
MFKCRTAYATKKRLPGSSTTSFRMGMGTRLSVMPLLLLVVTVALVVIAGQCRLATSAPLLPRCALCITSLNKRNFRGVHRLPRLPALAQAAAGNGVF